MSHVTPMCLLVGNDVDRQNGHLYRKLTLAWTNASQITSTMLK